MEKKKQDKEQCQSVQTGQFCRRDFLYLSAGGLAGVGLGGFLWPFVDQMNPSKDVLAVANSTIDLSTIAEGQVRVETWRNKPLFVLHRTQEMIEAMKKADGGSQLLDPQKDEERTINPKWLIALGICTHLGCVPNFTTAQEANGKEWNCPCHGSRYDLSGRVVQGPAGKNLEVPPYYFIDDNTVLVGLKEDPNKSKKASTDKK